MKFLPVCDWDDTGVVAHLVVIVGVYSNFRLVSGADMGLFARRAWVDLPVYSTFAVQYIHPFVAFGRTNRHWSGGQR